MKYFSTHRKSEKLSFQQAVIQGLASDGGLFFPEKIPTFPAIFFAQTANKKPHEIAAEVLFPFVKDDISYQKLMELTTDALNFDFPLVKLDNDTYALELFHGTTLAFKDVGARMTARFMGLFAPKEKLTVLVATSGDTGSAVANGFLGVEGVDVVVLYPKGKVSETQEKQFATLGKNITALEIDGTFDDCQSLVKQAFTDGILNRKMKLTSANSISIARLLPQMVYYFYAFAKLKTDKPLVFSVPSGNLGNISAGLIAKKMGLPVAQFLAATNINDVLPEYLNTQIFTPRPSRSTISNAMDVGNPSNFARITELYKQDWGKISQDITGYSFEDEQVRCTIRQVYKEKKYILDPHGAVAYAALKKYRENKSITGVFLETAHPAKFSEVVEAELNTKIELPHRLKKFMAKEKLSLAMNNSFTDFKAFLLEMK